MFSNVLPKVVYDVGAGGSFVTGARGVNALTKERLENKMQEIKNMYLPLTTQADAASKLAYSNLVGPQFVAKLFGNRDVLANLNPGQRDQGLQKLVQAGMNPMGNQQNAGMGGMQQPQPSLIDAIKNKIGNVFGQQNQQQNQSNNPFGQQDLMQGSPNSNADRGYSYDQAGNNIQATPQQAAQIANSGNNSEVPRPGRTFAENVGDYNGILAEGEATGKVRAKTIEDLDNTVRNSITKQDTLDDLTALVSSPQMREIRQLPLAGSTEFKYLSKLGTPEQQQMIGRLYAQLGNVVKDSSRDFAGQFRKGEQQLLNGMKPNDSDTVDTMIGKLESLNSMNMLLKERAELQSKYMTENHMGFSQAAKLADKELDSEKIKQGIHEKLNPKPTDDDISFMAKKYNLSAEEVKKKLKQKGVL